MDDASLNFLEEEEDDELELSFDDSNTPPAGTDVGDMDDALSQLLDEEEDDELELSFDDSNTPPAGTDVGDMDDALSQLLEEEDDELELSFDDSNTPPAEQMGDMDDALSTFRRRRDAMGKTNQSKICMAKKMKTPKTMNYCHCSMSLKKTPHEHCGGDYELGFDPKTLPSRYIRGQYGC